MAQRAGTVRRERGAERFVGRAILPEAARKEVSPFERLGLVVHGVFMFVMARYRRIEPA